MSLQFPRWKSLQTRLTLLALLILLLSVWAIAWYASRILKTDFEKVLGAQQSSVVTFMANQANDNLQMRLTRMQSFADQQLADLKASSPATLQARINANQGITGLFNSGVWISGVDGTVLASDLPVLIGKNYADRAYVISVLRDGKPAISKPIIGKVLKDPIFAMAVPVRDAQGTVAGVLVGVTDLSKPNFLDQIPKAMYGQTGGFLLISPRDRLVVTASDKRRVMEVLPPPGVNAALDRRVQGDESAFVFVNTLGEEVLGAAKAIPVAGWFLAVYLPTAEAFVPVNNMLRQLWWALAGLTVLAGAVIGWMLRHQLKPLTSAVLTLEQRARSNQPQQPLPIVRQDEIGELIGGFNHLLDTLGQRELALETSVRDKEALLKEVHHRVKNNLQVISSLLRLEGRRSTETETRTVLGAMQARIRSMALLHESLYRKNTLAAIDLGEYLQQLTTQAFQAQATLHDHVDLKFHMESVWVGMDQAVTCGLLVNELISNCLKHAFPDNRKGEVQVALQPMAEPQQWLLSVTDTGVGMPKDAEDRRQDSLGLHLVKDLARQLKGELTIQENAGAGTAFIVHFRAMSPAPLSMPV